MGTGVRKLPGGGGGHRTTLGGFTMLCLLQRYLHVLNPCHSKPYPLLAMLSAEPVPQGTQHGHKPELGLAER